ncbi:DUF1294 domain-containing protein [Kordiimonas marina]|uniref:DUF1294 domain-containing protein n=1 Tax=Kordiimonas marina TaxID=2872312 RepID=UPI001FF68D45|nr:DUF1294 domain-containing protein [Kordiimonas marina]
MKSKFVWGQFIFGLVPTAFVAYVMVNHKEFVALYLYGGMSLLAALMYLLDKKSAEAGSVRVSESTLNLLAVLGGWAGMLVFGPLIRHKVRKKDFLLRLWLIVAAHTAFWGWLFYSKQTLAAWVAHLAFG